MILQSLLEAVFPPECLGCSARVEAPFSICGQCWSDTPFIFGSVCELCGAGLAGQEAGLERTLCDQCHKIGRPWDQGRAVFAYAEMGRQLVLGLKHGDRSDIARAAGPWLQRAGRDLLQDNPVLVPIPLHWSRLASRRYNQAALLAHALGRETGLEVLPDALERSRSTGTQDGKGFDGRFANVDDAFRPHRRTKRKLEQRHVVLIDDVMTSGATFSSAAQACKRAGAQSIRVLTLARVGEDA